MLCSCACPNASAAHAACSSSKYSLSKLSYGGKLLGTSNFRQLRLPAREDGTRTAALSGSTAAVENNCCVAHSKPAVASTSFASLTRVLLIGQPSNILRNLAKRKWPASAGPISLLLFLFGLFVALLAAVRNLLVRRVKSCQACKGFGIVRCKLCNGQGKVDWRAKFNYSEVCPLCLTKRYVECPDCGGFYHRKMFTHGHANYVVVPEPYAMQATDRPGQRTSFD